MRRCGGRQKWPRMGLPGPLALDSGSFARIVMRPVDEKAPGGRDGDPFVPVAALAGAKYDHLIPCLRNEDGDGDGDNGVDGGALPEKASEGDRGGWVVPTADQVVNLTHDWAHNGFIGSERGARVRLRLRSGARWGSGPRGGAGGTGG